MKVLAMLLTAVLLACALPALASQPMIVAWWGNQTRNERTQAALELYAQTHEGTAFDPQFVAWADYWSKLASAAAGHTLPDVLQMDYQYLKQYAACDLLVDLTPYAADGSLCLEGFYPGVVDSGRVDGGLYAVCAGVNAPSLLYNKTALDAVGITVPDNMDLDVFLQLCREVHAKTGLRTNIGFGTDMLLGYLLRGCGKALFDGDHLAVTADDVEPFFALYETGIREGWHVSSEVFAQTTIGTVEQDPMIYGDTPDNMSWCAFFWSNQMNALQSAAPADMEVGITTWPSADPARSNYLKPSQFFSVSVDAADPAAAVEVINYLINSVAANEILLGERGIPASADVAEAVAPLLDETDQKVSRFIRDVITPHCSNIPAADPPGAGEVYAVMDELEQRLCYGAITAHDAAELFVRQAEAILR